MSERFGQFYKIANKTTGFLVIEHQVAMPNNSISIVALILVYILDMKGWILEIVVGKN